MFSIGGEGDQVSINFEGKSFATPLGQSLEECNVECHAPKSIAWQNWLDNATRKSTLTFDFMFADDRPSSLDSGSQLQFQCNV